MTATTDFLFDRLRPVSRPHIVDVGASPRSVPCYAPLLAAGRCTVTGFEPQQDAFRRLLDLKGPDETYHPVAVGPAGRRALNVYRNGGFTSNFRIREASIAFLGRFARHTRLVSAEEMETVPLDAIDMPPVDLLKIDVQGSEQAIIEGGRRALSRAVAIIPEVRFYPLYEGEPTFADLDRTLAGMGFRLHKFLTARGVMLGTSEFARLDGRAHGNQLVDGDAVYLRDLEDDASDHSDDELKRLAILADGAFDSRDLVVRCIDILTARAAAPKGTARDYVDLIGTGAEEISA